MRDLSKDEVSAATAAPSDFEVVLSAMIAARRFLARAEARRDPLELARLRGAPSALALLLVSLARCRGRASVLRAKSWTPTKSD